MISTKYFFFGLSFLLELRQKPSIKKGLSRNRLLLPMENFARELCKQKPASITVQVFSSLKNLCRFALNVLVPLYNIVGKLFLCSWVCYILILFGKKEALCPILVCTKPEKLPNYYVTRKVVIVSTHIAWGCYSHICHKWFSQGQYIKTWSIQLHASSV